MSAAVKKTLQNRIAYCEDELEHLLILLGQLRVCKNLKNMPEHLRPHCDSGLSTQENIDMVCERIHDLRRQIESLSRMAGI
jgi:hypothetical protein